MLANFKLKKNLTISIVLCLMIAMMCSCSKKNASQPENDISEKNTEVTNTEIDSKETEAYIQEGAFTVDVETLMKSIESQLDSNPIGLIKYERNTYRLDSYWTSDPDKDILGSVLFYKGSFSDGSFEEIDNTKEIPNVMEITFDLFKTGDSYAELDENATNAAMVFMRAVGVTKEKLTDEKLHKLIFSQIDYAITEARRDSDELGVASSQAGNASVLARAVKHGENNITVNLRLEPLLSEEEMAHRSTFTFGSYEQDNDTSNGKEPIEWTIIDKEDDKILIVSSKVLDYRSFYNEKADVTWEESLIRKWLNEDFINEAFGSDEQDQIIESEVINNDNNRYGTDAGNDTSDKVFLLSYDEQDNYFTSDDAKLCGATAYAIDQGCYISDDGVSPWLLRSPGENQRCVMYIDAFGDCATYGTSVDKESGIRPALWLKKQ